MILLIIRRKKIMAGNSENDPFNYKPLKRTKLSLKNQRQNKQCRPTKKSQTTAAVADPRQRKLIAVGQQQSSAKTQQGGSSKISRPPLLRLQG
jgi:hypothetical protein